MGKLIVVVGGQFGSEGKGEVAGWLVAREELAGHDVFAIRVAGPNAGHTVTTSEGSVALRSIPVAAVVSPNAQLAIAAGSEIDVEVLEREIKMLDDMGIDVRDRLVVDPSATMIDREHMLSETDMATAGTSTGKGIGAARASRLMRQARTWGQQDATHHPAGPGRGGVIAGIARDELAAGATVLIEGTQGYGLGLHTPYYPKTTSSDCRAVDFVAMAGISPWSVEVDSVEVWVVVRNRAIRIAGDSGPLDNETSWPTLGIAPEYTTVTKKVRRVGGFMPELVKAAIVANGGPGGSVHVALTHLDHEFPGINLERSSEPERWLEEREEEIGQGIELVGTGPGRFWHDPTRRRAV